MTRTLRRDASLERLAIRLLFYICVGLSILFMAEVLLDLWRSGKTWAELESTSRGGQGLASTVSRAFNNLTAMVLTFIALAVPITANMYTPKLIEIFVRDPINIAAMVFYAAMGAHAIFVQSMMFENWSPKVQYFVLVATGVVGFAILIPYYFYVLSFLNPATIIRRVRDVIFRDFDDIAAGVDDIPDAQRRLDQELLNFGNVVLRAVDRADRDVSIDAVSGLRQIVLKYLEVKSKLPDAWFLVDRKRFGGYTEEAIAFLERDRIWVEHRCLHQLMVAYSAALAKMPDAISAISDVIRRIAESARDREDDKLLALCVRYFNTFLREAVKKKDVHAIYDVSSQYAELAIELLHLRPGTSVAIARHLKYYAEFARWQGMAFIYELAASDLASVVEAAHEEKAGCAEALLRVFASFESDKASVRLTKSQAVLAAYFAAKGLEKEGETMRACLMRSPVPLLEAALTQLLTTEDPIFWEVTDRQKNLDYVHPDRREAVRRVLDAVIAAKRAGATA